MTHNAVVADGVAGFRRLSQFPSNSRLDARIAFCALSQLSEKRGELS